MVAPLLGRIGLGAPFGIRAGRVDHAVGQRRDPPVAIASRSAASETPRCAA
jgi:hypothetical protein